jgi:hypothetical protein
MGDKERDKGEEIVVGEKSTRSIFHFFKPLGLNLINTPPKSSPEVGRHS